MSRDLLRAVLRLGVFIGGCGLVLMFIEPPESAEFVLSVCSTAMGAVMVVLVVVLIRVDFAGWLERVAARREAQAKRTTEHTEKTE